MSLYLSSKNKTGKYIYWTPEDIEKLKNLLSKNISMKSMVPYFTDRTYISINSKVKKLGLDNSGYRFRKYVHNENFWSEINPITCYYAGYIAADGNLSQSRKEFSLSLSGCDINILRLFKKLSSFTGPIDTYKRKNYKKETLKTVSTIRISCKDKWYDDLEKNFNITPIKTYRLSYPNINDDYLKWCFIIGYIDGDGWTTFQVKRKDRCVLGMVSCSFDILRWINQEIDKKFSILYNINHKKSKIAEPQRVSKQKYYEYIITGFRANVIIDYIRQFPLPKLSRKWDRIEILKKIDYFKEKYPQYFEKLTIPEKWQSFPKYSNTPIYDIENDPENLFTNIIATK